MNVRAVILGAGESGVGAAILAKKLGYDVFVSDKGEVREKFRIEMDERGVKWEQGKHTEEEILNADVVIKSPGIPEKAELIVKLKENGTLIISEIEFAARNTDATLVAITGSNGKTTTTALTHHILKNAGLNVGLAGNIGYSFARQVAEENFDHYVLEISSFQLDDIDTFKPHVGVLMNITPDHLDRYNYDFSNYIHSKFRITENQTHEDFLIYCSDDEVINEHLKTHKVSAALLPFSIKKKPDSVAYIDDEQLFIHFNKSPFSMYAQNLSLKGNHNAYNSMAAGIAARIFDIRRDVIRESLSDFRSLEHRLEFVAKIQGVDYINDSKATNVNSTWYALETMEQPVVWIVGGVDKGNDYDILVPVVKKKVKAIVCLGENNLKIHAAFSRHVDLIMNANSAVDAVRMASQLAGKGDVVLLSPACASFDLFRNYEDRGNQFKLAVREL